jgi:hypothetical protein
VNGVEFILGVGCQTKTGGGADSTAKRSSHYFALDWIWCIE